MKSEIFNAKNLDNTDPFKPLTHFFDMPLDENGNQAIYLNGNSLGPKPKSVDKLISIELKNWGMSGVRKHFDGANPWISYHELVTKSIARLLGALPEEVVAVGTLSSNLHYALVSFYNPTPNRFKIITISNFPSDKFVILSQIKQRIETIYQFTQKPPFNLKETVIEINPEEETHYIRMDTIKDIIQKHGETTAVIWIEAIHFLTGQYFNIEEIAHLAHEKGCKIGIDLAHAIGSVPLFFDTWKIDFAVWCGYKYLSAGPGAIGGLFINKKYHTDPNIVRFAGWWGHNQSTRFSKSSAFDPIPTAESWQVSNPNIFALAILRESLHIFDDVCLLQLREKNMRLMAYLENLILNKFSDKIEIITPKNPFERGCQLTLRFIDSNGAEIENKLWKEGIICDVRENMIRVAIMGLYNTYRDLAIFIDKLHSICYLQNKGAKQLSF